MNILSAEFDVYDGCDWRRIKIKGQQTVKMLLALIDGATTSADMPRGYWTSGYISRLRNLYQIGITSTRIKHKINSKQNGTHTLYRLASHVVVHEIEYDGVKDAWWKVWV